MKNRAFIKVVIASIGLLALVACKEASKSSDGAKSPKKEVKVLAEVNGKAITSEDFDREVKALPEYVRAVADTPKGRKEMIDTLVMRELILQSAAKEGIDKSKDIDEKLADIRKRLVIDTYLKKKIESEAKISDEEMKSFYDQNKDKFQASEMVKASHILLKSEDEAKKVLEQLKGGAKFEDLAKKVSVDSSAAKGGDLGWFSKGNMVPAFEKAVYALKEGQTSGIIKSEFGYHIIMLTGKRAAGLRPFEEAKDQIKAALMPGKQQEAFKKFREDIKKGAKIEVKDEPVIPPANHPGVGAPSKPQEPSAGKK